MRQERQGMSRTLEQSVLPGSEFLVTGVFVCVCARYAC